MLTQAIWFSFTGPFLGDWVGIMYHMTYMEARGRLKSLSTWVVLGIYVWYTIMLAILFVDLAPHAWRWIEGSTHKC